MGDWDICGVRKMIKLRLGDIRVDDFWNPFFQKCRGASGDYENGLKTSQKPKINYFLLG